jgi:glycosyltransferase involved in cell wall biosynthesis
MIKIINIVDDYSLTSIPVQQSKVLDQYKNLRLKTIYLKKTCKDSKAHPEKISVIRLIKYFKNNYVILSHHTKTSAILLVLSYVFKFNWVHFVHNDLTIQKKWKRLILKFVANKCYKIICNSKTTKNNLINTIPITNKKKIFYNYNGVDLEAIDKIIINKKYKKFTLLFVGRLVREKSLETLIDALYQLKVNYNYNNIPFNIKILGDGPYKNKLLLKINQLKLCNEIKFLGLKNRNFVYKTMKKSHCLISPSSNEGFCNVNIEAIACGLKVIASDIEVFQEIGKNYFIFFKQGNAKDLTEKIFITYNSYIQNKYWHNKNYRFIKNFSLHNSVKKIVSIIRV